MLSPTRLIIQLSLVTVVYATTFRPNCTTPLEGTNFVAPPNVRSTTGILWSSLYTMFICTWVIQHLNVPDPDRIRRPFVYWKPWTWIKQTTWTRLKWMIITLIAPEILVGMALTDYISAHIFVSLKEMKNFKNEWTLVHGYYANQGGLLLHGEIETDAQAKNPRAVLPFAINSAQLSYLLKEGLISAQSPISDEQIEDKGKSDSFAKASALLQFVWLIAQLITRKVQGHRTSQLEIMALSFATSSIVTYALWFEKPQNIETPTNIALVKALRENDMKALKSKVGKNWEGDWVGRKTIGHFQFIDLAPVGDQNLYYGFGLAIGATMLGACHCIAWNFDFPTTIEQTLWRTASILTTSIVPFWAVTAAFLDNFLSDAVFDIYLWIAVIAYIVGRLYLIIAPFRDLFYLPPEAFITTTWTVAFPHFG